LLYFDFSIRQELKLMTTVKQQEEFNFRVYFKTSEGTELLNIFKNYRKLENLSKAEVMFNTLKDFKNKYPHKDTVNKMLSLIPEK
jgi:hypothetical protein